MGAMSLFTSLPIEVHEELAELVLPTWAFPAIAAGVFLLLAVVTWSYRDVHHRHSDKTSAETGSHQDAHH
jgi:hypothetical protein